MSIPSCLTYMYSPIHSLLSSLSQHSQVAFESISIADWLMSYKLSEYVTLFENNGYDNTDFLLGISVEVSLVEEECCACDRCFIACVV